MTTYPDTVVYELRRPDGTVLTSQVTLRAEPFDTVVDEGGSYWHHIYGEILPPWQLFRIWAGGRQELISERPAA